MPLRRGCKVGPTSTQPASSFGRLVWSSTVSSSEVLSPSTSSGLGSSTLRSSSSLSGQPMPVSPSLGDSLCTSDSLTQRGMVPGESMSVKCQAHLWVVSRGEVALVHAAGAAGVVELCSRARGVSVAMLAGLPIPTGGFAAIDCCQW